MGKKKLATYIVTFFSTLWISSNSYAIPSLQLGPGTGDWVYANGSDFNETGMQTWIITDTAFTINAYANAKKNEGGNGKYAWASDTTPLTAYLVASAVPKTNAADPFDISITGATFTESGYGAPPMTDPNSLAFHGIFDTYFEIYQFNFTGPTQTIYDTQPVSSGGSGGSGMGYNKEFSVTVNTISPIDGVHFDLYTLDANGQVICFAPFSHDAEYSVPEPSTVLLIGLGLSLLGLYERKRKTFNNF